MLRERPGTSCQPNLYIYAFGRCLSNVKCIHFKAYVLTVGALPGYQTHDLGVNIATHRLGFNDLALKKNTRNKHFMILTIKTLGHCVNLDVKFW